MTTKRTRPNGFSSLGVIGLLASVSFLALESCCEKKAQEMESRWDRFYQQRWACCQKLADLGHNDEAAECFSELEDDATQVGLKILAWQVACENENQEAMGELEEWLKDIAKSCIAGAITDSGGKNSNISSPLEKIEAVDIELEAVGTHDTPSETFRVSDGFELGQIAEARIQSNQFSGSICVSSATMFFCGTGDGSISYTPKPTPVGVPGRHYRPVNFQLRVVIAGQTMSLSLAQHPDNAMILNSDGSGVFKAALWISSSESQGLLADVAWFELPVSNGPDGISFNAAGLSGLEIAPQAPHAFADWNQDSYVDTNDYAAFLMDFAQGSTDLDLDGDVDDEDMAIFEYYFNEDFGT